MIHQDFGKRKQNLYIPAEKNFKLLQFFYN